MSVIANMGDLGRELDLEMAGRKDAEVVHEILVATADALEGAGFHEQAEASRRAARTLPDMFGLAARRDWSRYRRGLPIWKRWATPARPTPEWAEEHSRQLRAYGQSLAA